MRQTTQSRSIPQVFSQCLSLASIRPPANDLDRRTMPFKRVTDAAGHDTTARVGVKRWKRARAVFNPAKIRSKLARHGNCFTSLMLALMWRFRVASGPTLLRLVSCGPTIDGCALSPISNAPARLACEAVKDEEQSRHSPQK